VGPFRLLDLSPAIAAVWLASVQVLCAHVAVAQDDRPYVVVLDRDMTPAAGTTDLLTIERGAADLEDRWLAPSRFDESTKAKHVLGIAYRLGKWYGLDLPQDHFLMVLGHEVFGHGARLREINAHGISYGFDVPIPYGPGGYAVGPVAVDPARRRRPFHRRRFSRRTGRGPAGDTGRRRHREDRSRSRSALLRRESADHHRGLPGGRLDSSHARRAPRSDADAPPGISRRRPKLLASRHQPASILRRDLAGSALGL